MSKRKSSLKEADEEFEEVEVEGEFWEEEEEYLDWESEETQAAAQGVAIDLAFQKVNRDNTQDATPERRLLRRLEKDLARVFSGRSFSLEPFGSYVTDLGLPPTGAGSRSDLDVVVLFRNHRADSFEAKDVREHLVSPTINQLGRWLGSQPDITVKNIIRKARVPIVMFETKELDVDVSVQQPFGVLNSWHLRDLCASGFPGRLRALIRLIKHWVKSKAIHSAKDGSLSSYGWAMLAACYLQECGALPALMYHNDQRPYLTADEALEQVLDYGQHSIQLWAEPQVHADDGSCGEAQMTPVQLFSSWLRWMQEFVLQPIVPGAGVPDDYGSLPLESRYIASVKGRQQKELRQDVGNCKKNDHWTPATSQVYLLIEEPFTGENVARSVRMDALRSIVSEIERAANQLSDATDAKFKALLAQTPLSRRQQPPEGVGLFGVHRGAKRGKGDYAQGPPQKRQAVQPRSVPAWQPPKGKGRSQSWNSGWESNRSGGWRENHRGWHI